MFLCPNSIRQSRSTLIEHYTPPYTIQTPGHYSVPICFCLDPSLILILFLLCTYPFAGMDAIGSLFLASVHHDWYPFNLEVGISSPNAASPVLKFIEYPI